MFSKSRPLPWAVAVIVAILIGVANAGAQTSALSSGIEGRISDETGLADDVHRIVTALGGVADAGEVALASHVRVRGDHMEDLLDG